MKYFVAIEEDLLDELWHQDPTLVVPFSRPFLTTPPNPHQLSLRLEAQALLLAKEGGDDES